MPFDKAYEESMRAKLNRFAENPNVSKLEKLQRIQFYRVNWESQALNMKYLINHKLMVVKKVGDSYDALYQAWQTLNSVQLDEKSEYFSKSRFSE